MTTPIDRMESYLNPTGPRYGLPTNDLRKFLAVAKRVSTAPTSVWTMPS
jgi:hypothetical protein